MVRSRRGGQAAAAKIAAPRRGEVYLVAFDPTVGAEIQKTRPALIIQNDIANRHSLVTIVAAMTSRVDEDLYPTEVPVPAPEGGLTRDARLSRQAMARVDRALALGVGLVTP